MSSRLNTLISFLDTQHTRAGEVTLTDADGTVVAQTGQGLFQEDGGFSSYGTCCLSTLQPSPYTVTVRSKTSTFISLLRKDIDDVLGIAASAHPPMHAQPMCMPAPCAWA